MTLMYAFQMDVEQPLAMYDAVNAELTKLNGNKLPDGLLMHMATTTATGFQVIEVWESHEIADRYGDEVMRPVIERIGGADMAAGGPPPSRELNLHNLLTASKSDVSV
jgi:hypothetical protein